MMQSQNEVFVFELKNIELQRCLKTKVLFFSQRDPNSHDIYFLHNNFKILFSLSSQEVWVFFDIFYSPNLHNSYEGGTLSTYPMCFQRCISSFSTPLQCLKFVNSTHLHVNLTLL